MIFADRDGTFVGIDSERASDIGELTVVKDGMDILAIIPRQALPPVGAAQTPIDELPCTSTPKFHLGFRSQYIDSDQCVRKRRYAN